MTERERLNQEAKQQHEIVGALESVLRRSLSDDEKIRIFKGDILLPVKKTPNVHQR